jgi:hypothetical protein
MMDVMSMNVDAIVGCEFVRCKKLDSVILEIWDVRGSSAELEGVVLS